jgi:hypothetical protein
MCFSADASFMAAAATAIAGAVALSRTAERADWPLAAMPLFFAVQQTVEGFLWQTLPAAPGDPKAALLTGLFMLFALVFWPIYAPVSVWLIEPDRSRRAWMLLSVTAGVIVSLYFAWTLASDPRSATIASGHIVYSSEPDMPRILHMLYPLAVCGAGAFSSQRPIRLLSLILIVSSLVAYAAFWHAFSSVWCYFAALASLVIVFQFAYASPARRAARLTGPR